MRKEKSITLQTCGNVCGEGRSNLCWLEFFFVEGFSSLIDLWFLRVLYSRKLILEMFDLLEWFMCILDIHNVGPICMWCKSQNTREISFSVFETTQFLTCIKEFLRSLRPSHGSSLGPLHGPSHGPSRLIIAFYIMILADSECSLSLCGLWLHFLFVSSFIRTLAMEDLVCHLAGYLHSTIQRWHFTPVFSVDCIF